MTDLRGKLTGRKDGSSATEMTGRKRNMSSISCCSGAGGSKDRGRGASVGGMQGVEKRRGFHTPVHDKVLDSGRGGLERKSKFGYSREREFYSGYDARSESRYTSVGEGELGVTRGQKSEKQKLLFSSYSSGNDIDIRNDPEYDIGYARRDEEERFMKMYVMAKEVKRLQVKMKISQDENQDLRWKLNCADYRVSETQSILNPKEDDFKHVECELLSTRRKVETKEVLIKDLVFETRNKREYIDKLEQGINVIKKTNCKLLGENAQIRKLAKKISDDSDNLGKVITELKAEREDPTEKMIDILESKEEVMIASKEEDKDGLKSESPQEEVNENQNLSDQKAALDIQQDADQA